MSTTRSKSKKFAEQAAAEVAIMCLDIPRWCDNNITVNLTLKKKEFLKVLVMVGSHLNHTTIGYNKTEYLNLDHFNNSPVFTK